MSRSAVLGSLLVGTAVAAPRLDTDSVAASQVNGDAAPPADDAGSLTVVSTLGAGAAATPAPPVASIASVSGPLLYPGGNLYRLEVAFGANGANESFSFFQPLPVPSTPQPLLVHFHAANGAGLEVQFFTTFVEEASARGWYLIAPDQAVPHSNGYTYSSIGAQERVQAVLDWALAQHNIDRDRIYAYGFSMGGGDVVNYAARHLDQSRGTFAAIVNHTGTTCLPDEYLRGLGGAFTQSILEGLFGGPPATQWFEYLRSSGIELDPVTNQLTMGGPHMAINLTHVPLWSWYSLSDPAQNLIDQVEELDLLLATHGALNPPIERVATSTSAAHTWSTLDETQVCDWFAQQTLVTPRAGNIRFDRNGHFHHFDLVLRNPEFAAFEFDLQDPTSIRVSATDNIAEIAIDSVAAGLASSASRFEVSVDTLDNRPVPVRLVGFNRAPVSVELDGVDVTSSLVGTNWLFDPSDGTLSLLAPDGAPHGWLIR